MAGEREGLRTTRQAIVVCDLPDYCYTPPIHIPIGYHIIGYFDMTLDPEPTVLLTKLPTFTSKSEVSTVFGDEPGVEGGVISGVNMAECTPFTWSTTVKAGGNFIVRDDDGFWMNRKNTVGHAIYQPTGGGSPASSLLNKLKNLFNTLAGDPWTLLCDLLGTYDMINTDVGKILKAAKKKTKQPASPPAPTIPSDARQALLALLKSQAQDEAILADPDEAHTPQGKAAAQRLKAVNAAIAQDLADGYGQALVPKPPVSPASGGGGGAAAVVAYMSDIIGIYGQAKTLYKDFKDIEKDLADLKQALSQSQGNDGVKVTSP